MAELVTDPTDPRLGHGVDAEPIPQHSAYLVLSDEERAKGFVRPVRRSYIHVGPPGPQYPLRPLTEKERELWGDKYPYFEEYPDSENSAATGRFWTQEQLDAVDQGCGSITRMSQAIAETYARQPHFYGATYCCGCQKHLEVGVRGEFVWLDSPTERVGT